MSKGILELKEIPKSCNECNLKCTKNLKLGFYNESHQCLANKNLIVKERYEDRDNDVIFDSDFDFRKQRNPLCPLRELKPFTTDKIFEMLKSMLIKELENDTFKVKTKVTDIGMFEGLLYAEVEQYFKNVKGTEYSIPKHIHLAQYYIDLDGVRFKLLLRNEIQKFIIMYFDSMASHPWNEMSYGYNIPYRHSRKIFKNKQGYYVMINNIKSYIKEEYNDRSYLKHKEIHKALKDLEVHKLEIRRY